VVTVAAALPALDAAAASYRDFVSPGHPLLDDLFPGPPVPRSAGAGEALAAALGRARGRLRYDPTPGRHDFADLRRQAAAAGGAPVVLNCIDCACALASYLRKAGFGADEVYVALGGRASPILAGGEQFHAWVALRREAGLVWIDPADLEPATTTGETVLAHHRLFALFNDRHLYFLDAEKRRALTHAVPAGSFRIYLFGRAEPPLAAAIADPGFHRVVRRMAGAGRCAAGEVEGVAETALAGWTAAGLLAREGEFLAPGRKLVLVSAAAERELFALAGESIDRYLGIAGATVPRLRAAYRGCAAARRWGWPEVEHAVVAGMLLDLSVGREFEILGRVQRERGANVVWAFERVSAVEGIGVVWAEEAAAHWGIGQIWHVAVQREPVRLGAAMVELVGRAALGQPLAEAAADLLYLRYHRLLQRAADRWEVAWPTFVPADVERLSPPLVAGGRRLLAAAILPVMARLDDHPWWRRARQDEAYRHAVLRLMLDYGTDRVFDAGLVAPAPRGEAPPAWGRFVWLGRRGDALPRSVDAEAGAAGDQGGRP
jgi:hypothetical protein